MKKNRQYTKPQTQRFYDEVPIGQEVDLLLDENNPNVPDGFVLMEGQTVDDSESPLDGETLPKIPAFSALLDSFIGMVADFAMNEAPDMWIVADGSELAIDDYPKLYDRYGTTHGALTDGSGGSGTTHFRIPDYREVARVGAGTNDQESIASHDVYDVGEFKDDQMQRIEGTIISIVDQDGNGQPALEADGGAFSIGNQPNNMPGYQTGNNRARRRTEFNSADSPDARTSDTTDGVTRGKRAGVLTCIFVGV